MLKALEMVNRLVWGAPALVMILFVGIYLSVKTRFVQIRRFPAALSLFFKQFRKRKKTEDGVSPYRALCTALAATVGTGNLAGVAGAIAIGGPGAVFWMWICGVFGMVTKYAEAVLAIRFRNKNANGEYVGGPMLMIKNGMSKKWHILASLYCFFGIVASFGVGNATQANAVIGGIEEALSEYGGQLPGWGRILLAVVLAVIVAVLLSGGAKRVGKAAEEIVPFAAVGYLVICCFVLVVCIDRIPSAFQAILGGAFAPSAFTGGVIGSAFTSLRVGAARGVFTNEAGMGTASIAHGSAKTDQPVLQGYMGIIEVFIDTIVICTMTALVILCSGVTIPYGTDVGISLTAKAFSNVCGKWVSVPIALSLCAFALATILGWSLYGLRCAQFLFGERVYKSYVALQIPVVIIGTVLKTGTIWTLAEIVNGLMALPNLIALAALTPELVRLTRSYETKLEYSP